MLFLVRQQLSYIGLETIEDLVGKLIVVVQHLCSRLGLRSRLLDQFLLDVCCTCISYIIIMSLGPIYKLHVNLA